MYSSQSVAIIYVHVCKYILHVCTNILCIYVCIIKFEINKYISVFCRLRPIMANIVKSVNGVEHRKSSLNIVFSTVAAVKQAVNDRIQCFAAFIFMCMGVYSYWEFENDSSFQTCVLNSKSLYDLFFQKYYTSYNRPSQNYYKTF